MKVSYFYKYLIPSKLIRETHMALWGNNDNKFSQGTVSVNYANRTVIGSGTTFGQVGCAGTGDVIRIGDVFGGATGYFGEAVITGVGGTQLLNIQSVAGLSGGEILDVAYQVTESPKFVATDPTLNQSSGSVFHRTKKYESLVTSRVAIGATIVLVNADPTAVTDAVTALDQVVYGRNIFQDMRMHAEVAGTSSTSIILNSGVRALDHHYHAKRGETFTAGALTVDVVERPFEGDLHKLDEILVGDNFVTLTSTDPEVITNNLAIGTVSTPALGVRRLHFSVGLSAQVVGLDAVNIRRGIAPGEQIFVVGGETLQDKETQVLGLSAASVDAAADTQFETGVGWVGIHTYTQDDGTLRVKKEILVAMSGITTGNVYPPTNMV